MNGADQFQNNTLKESFENPLRITKGSPKGFMKKFRKNFGYYIIKLQKRTG